MNPSLLLHEDLGRLLDHRGLLRRISEEVGADYKRLHEIITQGTEPRHSLGKLLEDWIECASILAITREDLIHGKSISFTRLMRLLDLKERVSVPLLRRKIEGVVELLGPAAKLVHPTPEQAKIEFERECSHQRQAKHLIDDSVSGLASEIEALLKDKEPNK